MTVDFSLTAAPQELKAEKHPNTILHGEESLIVNVHIFNVSMTIHRARIA